MAIIESLHFEEADIAEFCSVHGWTAYGFALTTDNKYRGNKSITTAIDTTVAAKDISLLGITTLYGRYWIYLTRYPMTSMALIQTYWWSEMESSLYIDATGNIITWGNAPDNIVCSKSNIPLDVWTEIMFCTNKPGDTMYQINFCALPYASSTYIDEFELNDSEYPPSLMDSSSYTNIVCANIRHMYSR